MDPHGFATSSPCSVRRYGRLREYGSSCHLYMPNMRKRVGSPALSVLMRLVGLEKPLGGEEVDPFPHLQLIFYICPRPRRGAHEAKFRVLRK